MPFDRNIIEQFVSGGPILRTSVQGLSPSDFVAHPVPGAWSIQQIVIHMQDSDTIGVDRMKRVIAERNPLLLNYDETAFSEKLFCDQQLIEDALTLFDLTRRQFARVLRALPDEAYDRSGIHSEAGKLTLGMLVKKYVGHFDHHLPFIHEKRALLGKPLSR